MIRKNGNLNHLYKKPLTEQQAKDYAFKKCTEGADKGNIYAWEAYNSLVECAKNGLEDTHEIPF